MGGLETALEHVPALRRRRIRVWLALVSLLVGALLVQALVPDWQVLPSPTDETGAWAVPLVLGLALSCEFVDSTLGMGYGTTLTPLLLLMGLGPLQVVPAVLLSEFATGLAGGLMHHRDGNVDFLRDRVARQTALLLSALSALGAVAAVTFAIRVPKAWLGGIIAVIILSVGVLVLATLGRQLRYRKGHIIGIGALAAFNKGLSGGGYGPLVSAGQVVSGLSPKQAVAVTSLAESFTCAVGLAAYLAMRGSVDWALAIPLTMGGLLSVPMATLTVRRVPESAMRVGVGAATCALGGLALAKLFL